MYDGQGHGLLVHILLRVAKVRGFIRCENTVLYIVTSITITPTVDTDQDMVWPTFDKLQPSPLAFYYYYGTSCIFLGGSVFRPPHSDLKMRK